MDSLDALTDPTSCCAVHTGFGLILSVIWTEVEADLPLFEPCSRHPPPRSAVLLWLERRPHKPSALRTARRRPLPARPGAWAGRARVRCLLVLVTDHYSADWEMALCQSLCLYANWTSAKQRDCQRHFGLERSRFCESFSFVRDLTSSKLAGSDAARLAVLSVVRC